MKLHFQSFVLFGALLAVSIGRLNGQHYVFDAGPAGTAADGTISLTENDVFTEGSDFGWAVHPDHSFVREDLRSARSAFLVDGVAARSLEFRADVTEGTWWVTLWIEAGTEDSTSMTLSLNDIPQHLDWHAFNPPAEPRTEIQSIYRLFHGSVSVTGGTLSIMMEGGDDLVRVLGIALTSNPVEQAPALMSGIRRLGAYGPHLALEKIMAGEDPQLIGLIQDLQEQDATGTEGTFAPYWIEQLEILRRAEENIRLMGWEWATDSTGQGIFDRFHQAVMQLDGLLGRPDAESYPLYERALFHRGRLHHWLYRERGGENTRIQGEIDLAKLYERHPHDQLLAMYNGERIDLSDRCDTLDATAGAPAWSILQLEALCRLRTEIDWWVNERQSETGEFGGKIGDDVELFRWWPPVVLSGDTTALLGWKRLADGVMVTSKVHKGYSRRPIDVEHASEFIADTAPEMVFYSDKPEYVDRLRFSADYFKNLWTGYTPSGRRYFKSAWFSSTEVDQRPPRNRDVEYNTRATKAVRYLAWKTGDPDVVESLHEWSAAWRDAAGRTDKGKPEGVVPASIRFPDEALNGDEPNWYRANMFWEYFDWEASAGTKMIDQLLFTYTLTGDSTLLEPMHAAVGLIREHDLAGWPSGESAETGSAEWAARNLLSQDNLWNSVVQWRFFTGNSVYDDLIERHGTPYARYRLTGDESHLVEGLDRLLDTVRYNTPLRTTEVLHTDRVRTPGAMHLKAMLTGDGTAEGSSPYYAASWEGTTDGFTALVSEAGFDRLAISIFQHGESVGSDSEVTLRLWGVEPGSYRMTNSAGGSAYLVEISERGRRVPIAIRPNGLTEIRFEKR